MKADVGAYQNGKQGENKGLAEANAHDMANAGAAGGS